MKKERNGERFLSYQGCWFEIVDYITCDNVTIKFDNGVTLKNRKYSHIEKGIIKNPMIPSVEGIGFEGVGKYSFYKNEFIKRKWRSVLIRCFSKRLHVNNYAYSDCTISKEWENFQNFAKWFDNNFKPWMDSTWNLDKDILKKGNRVYSSETCCLVPSEINNLFVKNNSKRGDYPIGVTKHYKKFQAYCRTNGLPTILGTFNTVEEAFQAYKEAKEDEIKRVAGKWRDKISETCYQALINYKVEIND